MFTNNPMRHFVDEKPDLSRNPFKYETRIDCDKDFYTEGIMYADAMRTPRRPDVCIDTMVKVEAELHTDGYISNRIPDADVVRINELASLL